ISHPSYIIDRKRARKALELFSLRRQTISISEIRLFHLDNATPFFGIWSFTIVWDGIPIFSSSNLLKDLLLVQKNSRLRSYSL
ncbi:MAG: hypothetical protein WA421_11540, partial [Nitrososphaeraceae archaeon]